MPDQIPYIRVFISSPGDVNAERKIALDVIDYFPNRPAYREKVAFRVVAWDKPGAGTAMLGTLTPQEAINRGLPRPSECDIVVVIFWSRMGTPFTDTDGTEYLSGTHWEMLDALNSDRPETLIFRRREEKLFKSSDKKGREQYDRVEDFFKSDLFYRDDGSIVRGVNRYETPDDFRRDFEIFFEELIVRLLERYDSGETTPPPVTSIPQELAENITTIEAAMWKGSPFPGLRAFTETDAPIFFGRGRETDALVQQLENSRFVAVVGASGSGKSSLVGAGLIPRLRANALRGSADWLYARFTPGAGKNPFEALMIALMDTVPSLTVDDPFERDEKIEDRAKHLHDKPERLVGIINHALKDADEHIQLLLFIDQFEELFTLANAEYAAPFAAMLACAAKCMRLRVVVTMRHDFYHRAVEIPDLAELLRADAVFSLAIPRRDALRDMIQRPAERAGLEIENGLVDRILDDTGEDVGALALMAYALDELYKVAERRKDHHILFGDYHAIGGVRGAIGTRSEEAFQGLPGTIEEKEEWLQRVFRDMVSVDERGTATRRRVPLTEVSEQDYTLVERFIQSRLLVVDHAMVEVAHEALLHNWPRLHQWIERTRDDLFLLHQVRSAAVVWAQHKNPLYLWRHERLAPVYEMLDRLKPKLNEVEKDFVRSEAERLIEELDNVSTPHARRVVIGDRLAEIGDIRKGVLLDENGLPEIDWCYVPGGTVTIRSKDQPTVKVPSFLISKYPVTQTQYDAFLNAEDGYVVYKEQAFLKNYDSHGKQESTVIAAGNRPAINITWREAVVFCKWLSDRFQSVGTEIVGAPINWEIRLPTEQEWIIAATQGDEGTAYPWGNEWNSSYANTVESNLGRTTAVGMYPQGKSWVDVMDLSGNVWEWGINLWYWRKRQLISAGTFHSIKGSARATAFDGLDLSFNGFRLVCGVSIDSFYVQDK